MNRRTLSFRYSLVLVVLILITGCVKRELYPEPGESVRINFDWKNLSDPALLPSGMQLWFYGADNMFLSRQSAATYYEGRLPAGTYRVICYNPDATGIGFRNTDCFGEAEAYLLSGTGEKDDLQQPGQFYASASTTLTVETGKADAITIAPESFVRQLQIQIQVGGDQPATITGIQATIGGIATGVNLSTGLPLPGGNGTITQTLSGTGTGYESTLSLFGGDEQNTGKLTLTLTLSDGSTRQVSQHITDALKQLNQQQQGIPLVLSLTLDITKIDGVFVGTIQDWEYHSAETVVH